MLETTSNTFCEENVPTSKIARNESQVLPQTFPCHLIVTQDGENSFSAVALNLPGAGSCGDTEVEAIENAKEAIRDTIESYFEAGLSIPWLDTSSARVSAGEKQLRIIVNV